jgi:hypothetical protein
MLKLWSFWFKLFLPSLGQETPTLEGRRLRPKMCFRHFHPEFWPGTFGYLFLAGDSDVAISVVVLVLVMGLGVFLTLGRRLGPETLAPKGRSKNKTIFTVVATHPVRCRHLSNAVKCRPGLKPPPTTSLTLSLEPYPKAPSPPSQEPAAPGHAAAEESTRRPGRASRARSSRGEHAAAGASFSST